MALVRPRLTDYHNIAVAQEQADFAIPFFDEDIPLSIDPFLLWKSPALQDQSLHTALVNSFNHLGKLVLTGKRDEAKNTLIQLTECSEIGLGFSGTRKGVKIGAKSAEQVLNLFEAVPQLKLAGFTHFEEIQLLVDNVSKDRVSDIAGNLLMSFLIDYTIDQSDKHGIPTEDVTMPFVYHYQTHKLREHEKVKVPVNPTTKAPIILVPKRWLRSIPWINFDDYISNYYLKEVVKPGDTATDRVAVLNYNREHYDAVSAYTMQRERTKTDCKLDPLFKQLPTFSVARKVADLKKLPTGMQNDNDQKYEDIICHCLPTMFYPHLDFAKSQSRTDSGVLIRDLIFYNSQTLPFLKDIYRDYGSQQIVFEMKNVKAIERDHVNQLNRYLNETLGKFGVIVTRNPIPKPMFRSTIDLWSGQRRCIIALDDSDLEMMSQVFQSKQRNPIEVVNKKVVEFLRACPS